RKGRPIRQVFVTIDECGGGRRLRLQDDMTRSAAVLCLPRFYPILDASLFPSGDALFAAARELTAGGVTILQYRNKSGDARKMLEQARELKALGESVRLIMNDRADLCLAAGFGGVHVGQEDLSPEGARRVIGPNLWLGVSTHTREQVQDAD